MKFYVDSKVAEIIRSSMGKGGKYEAYTLESLSSKFYFSKNTLSDVRDRRNQSVVKGTRDALVEAFPETEEHFKEIKELKFTKGFITGLRSQIKQRFKAEEEYERDAEDKYWSNVGRRNAPSTFLSEATKISRSILEGFVTGNDLSVFQVVVIHTFLFPGNEELLLAGVQDGNKDEVIEFIQAANYLVRNNECYYFNVKNYEENLQQTGRNPLKEQRMYSCPIPNVDLCVEQNIFLDVPDIPEPRKQLGSLSTPDTSELRKRLGPPRTPSVESRYSSRFARAKSMLFYFKEIDLVESKESKKYVTPVKKVTFPSEMYLQKGRYFAMSKVRYGYGPVEYFYGFGNVDFANRRFNFTCPQTKEQKSWRFDDLLGLYDEV